MLTNMKLIQWLPRLDRLWWWLALVSVIALLGQQIVRSSSFAVVSAAEFEGFGDESDESEDDTELNVVVPPPVVRRPGFETDRGPPSSGKERKAAEDAQRESANSASSMQSDGIVEDSHINSVNEPKQARHEYWDEDEFEGLPEEGGEGPFDSGSKAGQAAGSAQASNTVRPVPVGPQSYYVEASCIVFLVAFAFTYFVGKRENETIALKWAAQYACKDEIFERNFSLLGTGDADAADAPLLIKEGHTIFKFYASGRRYCQGLLATMELQSRHDLLARIWYLASPKRDEMTIDVYMNDENMEPITFALVRKKAAKAMQKEWTDLQLFASVLSLQSQKKWLSEELAVISESRDLATDLLTDIVLDQVFGEKAFEKYGGNFISLHVTDQFPFGSHKKVLQFKFLLPSANRMEDMKRLIGIVPYYIDLVGRYKLSSQSRSRAEAARAKVAQVVFKEAQNARQEALQKKKEERRKVLEDTDSRIVTEALRKKEEKERQRQARKSMPRIKMTRVH